MIASFSAAEAGLVELVWIAAVEDTSLAAFSNSFFASPTDLASSGSFCGPQRKTTRRTPTAISSSEPTSAKYYHAETAAAAGYKNSE